MQTKYSLFISILFLLFASNVSAQETGKISGELQDATQKGVEGAVVSLFQQKDSALIKAILTEIDGKFEFSQLKANTYFLVVNHLSFQNYNSNAIELKMGEMQINLPIISLNSADATIKEVNIVAKVPFVEKKIDRTVINPDALISNAGTNALEVLEKAPGVQVDINGNISLKGKTGVLVYIDDKPTYLAASELANYLKSVPASSLGTIEIMTNPPAKYDAEGNAGIINIRMKRTIIKGLNGSVNVSYGQGFYARTNNSLNLNYRINKFNFFTNASYNVNNSYQDLTINRKYYSAQGDLNTAFTQNTFIKKAHSGANVKLGMDYYINKKATLGVVLSGFDNLEKESSDNKARLSDGNAQLLNIVNAYSPSKRNFLNGSVNVNYDYKIDSTGKDLTFNADYIYYDSKLEQNLLSNTYLGDNTFVGRTNLVSNLPSNIDIKTAKIDYVNPFKNGGKFETGAKTSFIATNNIANFFDENNGILTVNNTFSNNFKYKENINAGYVNYSLEKKKFGIQAGLRYENTHIQGNQLGNATQKDSSFTRLYNSFFPTFYASYKLDSGDRNQLGFSYGRRIDRPNYQDMNPFTYPLDRFTLYAGNPFLQPTFSNNFELSHTYKNMITTTLLYYHIRNVINETIEQNTNTFYSRPGNIGKQITYGFSVNGAVPITKWWTLQLYGEVLHNISKGNLYNQQLNNVGTYFYVGPVNQFTFAKTWSAELAGSYQSQVAISQFVLIPVGGMRAAVAKKILKGKGSIKLAMSDLFYTFQPGGDIKALNNSSANWLSYLDTRVLTFSFSYRFSNGQGLTARTTGAADSEKMRVK